MTYILLQSVCLISRLTFQTACKITDISVNQANETVKEKTEYSSTYEERTTDQEGCDKAHESPLMMDTGLIPLRHTGVVKLPRRYIVTSFPQNCHATNINTPNGDVQSERNGGESQRFRDLNAAIAWIKQEIILLRQHDILLNRQFRDIHDTIQELKKTKMSSKQLQISVGQNSKMMDMPLENYAVRAANSIATLYETDISDPEEDEDFRPRTCSMKTVRDLTALARRRGSKELI